MTGSVAHATWPDVALWVLQNDGFAWALVAAVVLIVAWKQGDIVAAWSAALDRAHQRGIERRRETRELEVDQERLNADMRGVEGRLQLPRRDAHGHDGQGG